MSSVMIFTEEVSSEEAQLKTSSKLERGAGRRVGGNDFYFLSAVGARHVYCALAELEAEALLISALLIRSCEWRDAFSKSFG